MNLGEPKCIPEIAEARKPIDGEVQQLTLWQSEQPIGAANKILVPVCESPILAICPFKWITARGAAENCTAGSGVWIDNKRRQQKKIQFVKAS